MMRSSPRTAGDDNEHGNDQAIGEQCAHDDSKLPRPTDGAEVGASERNERGDVHGNQVVSASRSAHVAVVARLLRVSTSGTSVGGSR